MVQGLFANQRETNLSSTVALVEEVLHELGHPAAKISDPAAIHAWQLRKGSAVTQVSLIERTEFTHIRVCAIVMTMDPKVDRTALFTYLLGGNATLCGAAFAVDGDHVLLVAERSTLDLDRSEVLDTIQRVTTAADDHDDALVAKFGGTLGAT
jgi:hypothetical protein